MQEVIGPLGDFGKGRAGRDLGARGHRIIGGAAHLDGAAAEDRPVRALATVGHADTARVDDLPGVRQPGERHVSVPADHGSYLVRHVRQDLRPAFKPGVHHDDFGVIAWCRMAEHHRAEAINVQRDRVRQPGQPGDMVRCELLRGPLRDRVRRVRQLTASKFHQLAIGVAADPDHPLPQAKQPVEHLHWLRSGGDVPGEHNPVRGLDSRLRQHRLESGQHTVNVRKHRDRSDHRTILELAAPAVIWFPGQPADGVRFRRRSGTAVLIKMAKCLPLALVRP